MKVKDLFYVLHGNNSIQFATDTCEKLKIEDVLYCRQAFFHKFRRSDVWEMEIGTMHTSIRPLFNTQQTILTLTLK